MLKNLKIEQFVIIDKLDLEFNRGLTVLTGETGAGKSILLDAMGLILGDPSSPRAIREGSDRSTFEAHFQFPETNAIWKFLVESEICPAPQKDLIIRRVMPQEGTDDITVNGKAVELDVLKKIGTFLCEIHGQHANQTLLDPSNQLHLLDLSGNFPQELFKNVAEALENLHKYTKERDEENTFFTKNIQSLSTLEALARKFEAVGLHEESIADMEAEYIRLTTAHEASEAFQEITSNLVASNGAIKALTSAKLALTRHKYLNNENMQTLLGHIEASIKSARDAVAEATRLAPEYDIDTRPMRAYKERLQGLEKLAEEIDVNFEDMAAYYDELAAKVARLRAGRERIAELSRLITKSENDYRHHAHILTEKRIAAGKVLSDAINVGLPPLKLMGAEFKVQVDERPNLTWTPLGFNVITFTARMNPGQPFSPIAETASGGELARMVLALKAVLQSIHTIPTLVFDEVDTGIGGGAAAAVGERIAQLAETTQVLVITHSPQVAARGDQQLHVSKKSDGVTTVSVIRTLTQEQRVDEISRMLAGDTITAESAAAAKRLLDEASAAASTRRQKLKSA